MDEIAAETRLAANIRLIESYEVRARAGVLKTDIFPQHIMDALAINLVEDAMHLRHSMAYGSGEVDEDLAHALEMALREKDQFMVELGHMSIVEPALKALAELLQNSAVKTRRLLEILAVEEKNHYSLSVKLPENVRKMDEAFSDYIEANNLLMYVTVFPSDEGKSMLLTILGQGYDRQDILKSFYAAVDRLRNEVVSIIFGPDSLALKLVKGYGLAKIGIC